MNPNKLPSREQIEELGSDLIWQILENWQKIQDEYLKWKKEMEDYNSRTVENLSWSVAIIRALYDPDYMPEDWRFKQEIETEGSKLIRQILSARLPWNRGDLFIVEQAIRAENRELLRACGIYLTRHGGKMWVAFDTDVLKNELLKHTSWNSPQWNLEQLLKSEGAEKIKVKVAKKSVWLPAFQLNDLVEEEE